MYTSQSCYLLFYVLYIYIPIVRLVSNSATKRFCIFLDSSSYQNHGGLEDSSIVVSEWKLP